MACMVCAAYIVWYVGQRLIACGSICGHLETFGSIWEHLGYLGPSVAYAAKSHMYGMVSKYGKYGMYA